MKFKNWLWLFTAAAGTIAFSGCYAHSSHYTASYGYYEPAYVEEVVYVERPAYYSGYGHRGHGRRHCY